MALLLMLLLAATAQAQPADCAAVPVGPPVDLELYVDVTGRAKAPVPGRITAGLGLTRVPALGSRCVGPPPPSGDVLLGTDEPQDLLRGTAPTDVLAGSRADDNRRGEVVIGPAEPVPLNDIPVRP